jgi:hypothetical protein
MRASKVTVIISRKIAFSRKSPKGNLSLAAPCIYASIEATMYSSVLELRIPNVSTPSLHLQEHGVRQEYMIWVCYEAGCGWVQVCS